MTEIIALGGESEFSPNKLANGSRSDHVPGGSLSEMMCEDLVAERIAIDTCGQIIRYVGTDDSTTRRMLAGAGRKNEVHGSGKQDNLQSQGQYG